MRNALGLLPFFLAALAQFAPPSTPAGTLPRWLQPGAVYVYRVETQGPMGTQEAKVAYLVEAVGKQWAAVKMITVGDRPPQLATMMLAVNAAQSPFFVTPTLRQQVASGQVPGARLEGNTLILSQQGSEIRTTFDPQNGLVTASETRMQAMGQTLRTVMRYEGSTRVSLPDLPLPQAASASPHYRFSQQSPMGQVSGEIRYQRIAVDGNVVVYQVFNKSDLTQGAEIPTGIMAGSPIEGPFYVHPALFQGKTPGAVLQTIPEIGYRLEYRRTQGGEALLALHRGPVEITLHADPQTGVLNRVETRAPSGSGVIERVATPGGQGLPPSGTTAPLPPVPSGGGVGTPPPTNAPLPPAPGPGGNQGPPTPGPSAGTPTAPPTPQSPLPPSPANGPVPAASPPTPTPPPTPSASSESPSLPPAAGQGPAPHAGNALAEDPLEFLSRLEAPAPASLAPGTYLVKRIAYRLGSETTPALTYWGVVIIAQNEKGRAAGLTLMLDPVEETFLFLPTVAALHGLNQAAVKKAQAAGFAVKGARVIGESADTSLELLLDPNTGWIQTLRYREKGEEGSTLELTTVASGKVPWLCPGPSLPNAARLKETQAGDTLNERLVLAPIAQGIYLAQGDWELWGMYGTGDAFLLAAGLSPFSACPKLKEKGVLLKLQQPELELRAEPNPQGFDLVLIYQGKAKARLRFDAEGRLQTYEGLDMGEPYRMEVQW